MNSLFAYLDELSGLDKAAICLVLFTIVFGLVTLEVTSTVEDLREQLTQALAKCEAAKKDAERWEAKYQNKPTRPLGINRKQLRELVRASLAYMGVEQGDWDRLLLLTVITESDCGHLVRQVGGPANGISQVEPATERDTLDWLKARKPELYSKIKNIRVPARLSVPELQYNHMYSLCLSFCLYIRRGVDPIGQSTEGLAKLYKKYYNTYLGRATVEGVLQKVRRSGIKL